MCAIWHHPVVKMKAARRTQVTAPLTSIDLLQLWVQATNHIFHQLHVQVLPVQTLLK